MCITTNIQNNKNSDLFSCFPYDIKILSACKINFKMNYIKTKMETLNPLWSFTEFNLFHYDMTPFLTTYCKIIMN